MSFRSPLISRMLTFVVVFAATVQVSSAAEYYLRAAETTVTMPDGRDVPMWGFAVDSSFGAHDGTVTVPGPALEVPVGDSTLTIHLENDLPSGNPVSIVIPGQLASMTPVRHDAGSPYAGRVRSFTSETQPGNSAAVTYTWSNFRPGTYLYHSGSHPACQVQMGLYGCVKKDYASGVAYEGVSYDREIVVLLSEIDPDFHDAVDAGDFGPGKTVTSPSKYVPRYFLVNGACFTTSSPAIAAGPTEEKVLIRFLNAGVMSHSMMLSGLFMTTLAEDGFAVKYPRERYCLDLPPLKTRDVLVIATAEGTYPLFDRTLRLTNDAEPSGGMMTFLTFSGD